MNGFERSSPVTNFALGEQATTALLESLDRAEAFAEPYSHWIARRVFPSAIAATRSTICASSSR